MERQKGVGGERKTIPDEVRTQPIDPKQPDKTPRKTTIELKARNIHKAPSDRRSDIRASLEQNKNQLIAKEAAGEIGPNDRGKVVQVIYDNDKGKSATAARPDWKEEAVQVRNEWVEEASDPAERAKRERVHIVTTTQDRMSKATATTRSRFKHERRAAIASAVKGRAKDLAKDATGLAKTVGKGALQSTPILGAGVDAYMVGVKCFGPDRSVGGCADALVSAVPIVGDIYTAGKLLVEIGSAFESSPGSAVPAGFITPFVMKPLR